MIHTRRNSHSRRERQQAKSRQVRTQRRWLQPERLEERTMMSASPVHNDFWPEDVNNDLRVSALDALHVINAINMGGSRGLAAGEQVAGATTPTTSYFTDVSGDGILSPVDALRVVNTVNGGEGEISPDDVVRYNLRATDLSVVSSSLIGSPSISTINVGQTFKLWGTVKDNRGGSATGVFAAYMDVLMTNTDLAQIRYGETQELRMDADRPGSVDGGYEDFDLDGNLVYIGGTFKLTYQGQSTPSIRYYGEQARTALLIQQALESLPAIGAGNVAVSTLDGADFTGRFFVRFKRALGEKDITPMTVQGQDLTGKYLSSEDLNGNDKLDDYVSFDPIPQVVNDYISVSPTTDVERAALFRSSFEFIDPYTNGRSAIDEPLEAGQPDGSRNLGEVGSFLNKFSLSNKTAEYPLFVVEIGAVQPGSVAFSGNVADKNATLVFGQSSGRTDVDPADIGFVRDQANPLTITIAAPIVVVNDTATTPEDTATSIPVLTNDSVNTTAGGVAPLSLVAGSIANITPAGSATVGTSGSNVNFTPTANFSGQVTFTYQVRDSKAGTPNTATGTVTVNVTAVNDAPVVTLQPLPGPINEDAGVVTVPAGTISIADADAGTSLLQATLAVTGGTVTLNDKTGLTFTTGDGDADTNMVFTGTLAAMNNAASNATFNTAPNFNGTATVAVTVNDQGNTGSGGAKSDSKTLSITVTALNDPPVNTVPAAAQTVIELGTLTFAPPISTTDVEALAENKPVQVNLGVTKGKLNLGTQTGLTNVTGLGTGTVSFRGTVANVNAALATLTYQANAFPQSDTLTVTTSDLGTSPLPVITDTDTVNIVVVPSAKPSAVPDSLTDRKSVV